MTDMIVDLIDLIVDLVDMIVNLTDLIVDLIVRKDYFITGIKYTVLFACLYIIIICTLQCVLWHHRACL